MHSLPVGYGSLLIHPIKVQIDFKRTLIIFFVREYIFKSLVILFVLLKNILIKWMNHYIVNLLNTVISIIYESAIQKFPFAEDPFHDIRPIILILLNSVSFRHIAIFEVANFNITLIVIDCVVNT